MPESVFEPVPAASPAPTFPFILRQFRAGPHENFHYAFGDPDTGEVALVDPTFELDRLFGALEADGLHPTTAVFTHGHWDHMGGLGEVLDRGIGTMVAHAEAGRLAPVRAAGTRGVDVRLLDDGATFAIGQVPVRLLHTPGHQPETACYQVGNADGPQALFGGDTLFVGSCGRTDFPGGDTDALFASMARLRSLQGGITLMPGHDYGDVPHRSLAEERKDNPALATPDRAAFDALHCLRR